MSAPAAGSERRARLAAARLYLIAGAPSGGPGWFEATRRALSGGDVDLVQLREPDLADEALLAQARRLRPLCDAAGALLILNDRVALAAVADADGAHVGERDLGPRLARLLLGEQRLLGLSTHAAAEVAAARCLPVDYVGLGPCFPSASKELARRPTGPALAAAALPEAGDLPVFAIGGVSVQNAGALVAAGVRRLAVGAGILRAPDPAAAAARLAALLVG